MARQAGDVGGRRALEPQKAGRHILLPSDPRQHVSFFEEPLVAELRRSPRILGAARQEQAIEDRLVAPVRDFEEHGAVGAVIVAGPEHVEVGRELDQALRVSPGKLQVADDPIGG